MKLVELSLDDTRELALFAKAFSSDARIEIIKLLCKEQLNINEIAEKLELAPSTAAAHIKVLEEAGVITTTLLPGIRGSMKLCALAINKAIISVDTKHAMFKNVESIEMPIGNYVDYKVTPTCGIVGIEGAIGEEDEPRCFYHPDRVKAALIWLRGGYVEYRFPNNSIQNESLSRMEISAEICSEDHEYNLNCPSDITLWVNGIEAGTFRCPSDFGGRRGKRNPEWWPDKNTQYGLLKTWSLTEAGIYLDDIKCSDRSLHDFKLSENDYISVKFGIKEDAVCKGGMNLFGSGFGDYEQDIVMKIYR